MSMRNLYSSASPYTSYLDIKTIEKYNPGRYVKNRKIPCFYLLCLIVMVGCASPQKATYLSPSFDQKNIGSITILPIVDARIQRQFEINEPELRQIIYPVVEWDLKEKGYAVEYSEEVTGVQCLKFGRSLNLDPECLRKVGPSHSMWVLVIFLQDFQMRSPYGGAVSAKMSGVLFDRSEGLLLWSDLEYAGLSQRELVGKNMETVIANDVIQICTQKLISSLPQRPLDPKFQERRA